MPIKDLKSLQEGIAKVFSIVQPAGIVSYSPQSSFYRPSIVKHFPFGISIDGHAVRDPGAPIGLPFFGNHFEIYPDHVGNHARMFARYGGVIKTNNMGRINYLTNDPEITRIAFRESEFFTKKTSDPHHPLYAIRDNTTLFLGDTHTGAFTYSHKFIPPSMAPKAARHYTPMLKHKVELSFKVFDQLDKAGLAFNVNLFMMKLAVEIIVQLVLGVETHHFDAASSQIHEIIRLLAEMLQLNKKVQGRGNWYSRSSRLKVIRSRLYTLGDQAVEACTKLGLEDLNIHDAALKATCLVDYLLRTADDQGQKLPSKYIVTNAMTLIAAGFVTSSSFLSWLVYALVTYSGAQERLLQELVNYGATGEKTWTYEEIQGMKYLNNFVKETQRLHSPSFQPGRNASKDLILPGGIFLPKDAVLIPTIPAVHTNPKHWTNPDRFDPDRWDTEKVKFQHKTAYIPFASRPRGCIGYNIAIQEMKVSLEYLVYRYHFENANDEPVEYDPDFMVIRPTNLYVRFLRRTQWPSASENV